MKNLINFLKMYIEKYSTEKFISLINIVEPMYARDTYLFRKEIMEEEEKKKEGNYKEEEKEEKEEEKPTFRSISKKVIDFLIDDLGLCMKINPLNGLNFTLICKGLFYGCSLIEKAIRFFKGIKINLLMYKKNIINTEMFKIINSCKNKSGLYCMIINILLYPISFFIKTINEKSR
ncbi:hypothetical protein ACWNYO_00020 [Candidatus Vidania fulgoroideorum]